MLWCGVKGCYRTLIKQLKISRRFFARKISIVKKFRRINRSIYSFGAEPWVLSRTACLGNEVRNLAFPRFTFLNFQKGRVDKLDELIFGENRHERPVPLIARWFLQRKDIWDLILELNQVLSLSGSRPPHAILIDSYSELTDQLFQLPSKKSYFFANFGDVKLRFPGAGRLGLLPLEIHGELWRKMLTLFAERWGEVPVFLLTYPTIFESRQKFLERARHIELEWEKLEVEFDNVHLIRLPPSTPISRFEEDGVVGETFPYHYGPEVSCALAENVSTTMKTLEEGAQIVP